MTKSIEQILTAYLDTNRDVLNRDEQAEVLNAISCLTIVKVPRDTVRFLLDQHIYDALEYNGKSISDEELRRYLLRDGVQVPEDILQESLDATRDRYLCNEGGES